MTFIPRKNRPQVWARNAAEQARVRGERAIDVLCASMEAFSGFEGGRYAINRNKMRLEHFMKKGAADHGTRVEYGDIAYRATPTLAGTIREIELDYRGEVALRKDKAREGLPTRRNVIQIEKLQQARIFLRWYRRFGDKAAHPFAAVRQALTTTLNHAEYDAAYEAAMEAIGDAMQAAE